MKARFHPKALLSAKRNVRPGLTARTQIIRVLEKTTSDARSIGKAAGLSYKIIMHHLHLLEAEKVVARKAKRPFIWELTGAGQQQLIQP